MVHFFAVLTSDWNIGNNYEGWNNLHEWMCESDQIVTGSCQKNRPVDQPFFNIIITNWRKNSPASVPSFCFFMTYPELFWKHPGIC